MVYMKPSTPSQERFSRATPREGAQCPSCFTFNWVDYLPANRKANHDNGWTLKCALCGNPYELAVSPMPRAA